MPGKRDKAGNLTRARPGTHIIIDLQCNRAQCGRWRRQAATRRAALRPRRKHDASRPESDWRRSRCAINAPRPLSHAWPPMPGQVHRNGPHGHLAHGASQIRRCTVAVADRDRSCAAKRAAARTRQICGQARRTPVLRRGRPAGTQNRQHYTGRQARSAARGSNRWESCAPAWSWPAYRSAKGLHKPMTKKSGCQAARKGLKSHLRLYKLQKGAFDEFIHNFA